MKKIAVALALMLCAAPALAADQNALSWTDNSTNETGFDIQRGTAADVPSCATATFAPLARVGANVTTYVDTAVVQGTTYCYRVDASNASGASPFSNIAGRTVPFSVPAPPSSLTVN